ncbi:dipeptidase, partial [Veillonellaceae bacterium M2-4]|nr:dipeptidase [Veillonellaceae bacterium M2-4]
SAMWDKGTETYSSDSAYWVFKLASVLADRDWGKYGTDLSTTQDNTSKELMQIRHEYDQKLLSVSDREKEIELVDEANEKMANLAVQNYQAL